MLSIQQLREKRAAKAKEIRKVLDDAGENFTKEHKTQCDALQAEVELIDDQIQAIERQMTLENALDKPELKNTLPGLPGSGDPEAQREAEILNKWLRNGFSGLSNEDMEHIRSRPRGDMSAGDAAKGGYTVPRDFAAQLLERLKAYGDVRSIAQVIQTDGGNPIDWPTVDETAEEGEIVGESQSASDGDMTFGTVSIGAHKYSSKVIAVPIELLQDTRIDLVGFIVRALATRIARIQNKHFTTGTGVNQPRGIITAAAVGKTTTSGQTTSLIYEDFVDLEHSVDPAYRLNNPSWMFNDAILKAIKKLKDSTGRPLWLPGLSSADPDTFLRYRYTINQHMAASIAASAKSVAFGDFSKYLIRDVMGVTLLRFDDSAYARKGQTGFLSFARCGADLIDASNDAIKVIQQAAS